MILLDFLIKKLKQDVHTYTNIKYWTQYYKTHREMSQPSSFAQYCYAQFLSDKKDVKLLELGCGNGRDTLYFMRKGIESRGLDLVGEQIKYLRKKYLKEPKISFNCKDFTKYSKPEHYDYVYSRFTLHTVTEEQETRTLQNSYKNLKNGGLIFIEARSIKDDMFKKSVKISSTEGKTNHYRRFIVYDAFIKKMQQIGFKIVSSVEAQNLAIYNDENPYVIRVIGQKL